MESTRDQFLVHFVGTLFDWSRAWGLTNRDYAPMFIESLSHFISFFCICL